MRKIKKTSIGNTLGTASNKDKAEKLEYSMLYVHLWVHMGIFLLILGTVGLVYFWEHLPLQGAIAAITLYIILILWIMRKYRLYKRMVRLLLWGHQMKSNCNLKELIDKWEYVFLEGFIESDLTFSKSRPFKIHFSLKRMIDELARQRSIRDKED